MLSLLQTNKHFRLSLLKSIMLNGATLETKNVGGNNKESTFFKSQIKSSLSLNN